MIIGLSVALVVVSIILLTGILLQPTGSGLGTTWSGGGETYHTRRGLERVVFAMTIVAAILFTIISAALLFASR